MARGGIGGIGGDVWGGGRDGVLAMQLDPTKGAHAFWIARPEVRPLILEHAERRAESERASLTSLHQRLSQVSALMIAGAAVSTTVVASGAKIGLATIVLAASASCVFAVGGIAALVGLFSGRSKFPGDLPSWWAREGDETLIELDKAAAEFWIAAHYEEAILSISAACQRRAVFLNSALVLACLAGALTAGAGISVVHVALKNAAASRPPA